MSIQVIFGFNKFSALLMRILVSLVYNPLVVVTKICIYINWGLIKFLASLLGINL